MSDTAILGSIAAALTAVVSLLVYVVKRKPASGPRLTVEEEIARRLRGDNFSDSYIERMTGAKPKTREQVLEEALRNILRSADDHVRLELRSLPLFIQHEARRALEWTT